MEKKPRELIEQQAKQELGVEVLAWRYRNKVSQSELAKRLGMSRWSIAKVEANDETVSDAVAYKVWAFLMRELKKETITANTVDEYSVAQAIKLGKRKVDQENKIDITDWEVDKE